MTAELRLGVAGLGTVGGGLLRLLAEQAGLLERRAGRRFRVVAVSARNRARDRGVPLGAAAWCDDPVELARRDDVDVVVELIGGEDGPALALARTAIARGKHLVTANKAMLARHGTELAEAAERAGVALDYEAAVAGGIPIVKALREALAGNRFSRISGILNGTCNYILTQMQETGRAFADVLAEAQKLGYAEADPAFDIDGVDAAHKLAILTSVAFGRPVDFDSVHVEGIRRVDALDIRFARELGLRIKLLATARRTETGIEQRVHPAMVPQDSPLAHVNGVFNAVVAEGDYCGRLAFVGRGAGAGPTASAVVGDLVDIARGLRVPVFSVPADRLEPLPAEPMQRHVGAYYVRLTVTDKPGVIADVAAILRDERISIGSLLQHGRDPDEAVPVVMVTHETSEQAMLNAMARIGALEAVREPPTTIRMESL